MANAAKHIRRKPVRMMIAGYPGTAKTGMLASLANMGYKLRILDFDGNLDPLLQYTKPEFLKNIDFITLKDKLTKGREFLAPTGKPTAFINALEAMDEWKYEEDGKEINLGHSKDWGCDTIVVLDSLTSMGRASFRRVMALLNKTPRNTTQQVWGLAMAEQEAFIEKLASPENNFNLIVLSHLKAISPKEVTKDDDDITKELKERIVDLVPTKLFPNALGQALPPVIGGHFPTLILAESKVRGRSVKRIIRTQPQTEIDLKVPIPNIPETLEIEDGLAYIFSRLAPPLDECQETNVNERERKNNG